MSCGKYVHGLAIVCIGLGASMAQAANMRVTNVAIAAGAPAGQTDIKFDISWDASWRSSWTESGVWTNWDAAWVFAKYREEGAPSWSHATLSTNASDHTAPAGSTIDVGLTGTNGIGAFLYRSAEGFGSWTNAGAKLRWLYEVDGLAGTSQVDVCVHAIEMVYVPEGAYELGDGNGSSESIFALHATDNTKVGSIGVTLVSNITADSQMDTTIGIDGDDGLDTDNDGSVDNADFPTGYKAFYCAKYEISQGQYADFLNQLASGDATARYPNQSGNFRHTISGTHPSYTAVVDRACNYLNWADGAAYADWSGLRPPTELEFEKACRGPLPAAVGEYAWGNTTLAATTSISNDATATATANPAAANCNYSACTINGPYRCGIYADASSDRTTSGATYWGIMEMSGSQWTRVVTVGNATGRAFTGLHGDGELSGGVANVANWPPSSGGSEALGAGYRGGSWWNGGTDTLPVSARNSGAVQYAGRHESYNWRVVRSAP